MANFQDEILKLADTYKIFSCGGASVCYMRNDKRDANRHMFGFWKFDESAANNKKVFDELESYCCGKGIRELIGPMNYATWFEYRLPVDNFDFDIFPDIAGSAEQAEFLDNRGYARKWKYFSTLFEFNFDLPHLKRNIDLGDGYEAFSVSGAGAERFAADNYAVSCDCFSDALFSSPIEFEDYCNIYLKAFESIMPAVVVIKYNSEPVAFSFAYESLDKKYFIGKTIGIKKSYRTPIMFLKLLQLMVSLSQEYGHKLLAYHYQHEQVFKNLMKGEPIKTKSYCLFHKSL
jgi:hypothetical protein